MLLIPLVSVLLLAAIFLPGWYVGHVMRRYNRPRQGINGEAMARQLLDQEGLQHVGVELTEQGDHYDPQKKMVRLSRENLQGSSLTAITVAAHEVGHAIQDRDDYGPMRTRTHLVLMANTVEKLGAGLMLAWPVITILSRSPLSGGIFAILGVISLLGVTLVHLVTLPVEFDASFGRALPMLEQGGHITKRETHAARRILRAAALTYVAASLGSLLNLGRWIGALRR